MELFFRCAKNSTQQKADYEAKAQKGRADYDLPVFARPGIGKQHQ